MTLTQVDSKQKPYCPRKLTVQEIQMKIYACRLLVGAVALFATVMASKAQTCAGCLDPAFGSGGSFIFSSRNTNPAGMVVQADNKIVALFRENDSITPEIGYLIRLTPDGVLDNSFGVGGLVSLNWGSNSSRVNGLGLQTIGAQQRIVVAGSEPCGRNKTCLRAEAYTADGSLDANFGSAGITRFSNFDCGPSWISTQPSDQKLLMVGGLCPFIRLTANGQLDSSFGSNGIASTSFLYQVRGAPVVLASGKILLPGSIQKKGGVDLAVARYNSNGSLDDGGRNDSTPGDSFGISGVGTTHLATSNTYANWVAVDSVGSVVVAGNQAGSSLVTRLSSNGQLDTAFGVNGFALFNSVPNNFFEAVTLQSDGMIVIAGSALNGGNGTNDLLVARFSPSGTLDASFGTNGWSLHDIYGLQNTGASPVLIQLDPTCLGCERILVIGAVQVNTNPYSWESYILRVVR
jgi:uncharacterized delta-60 repeat protein